MSDEESVNSGPEKPQESSKTEALRCLFEYSNGRCEAATNRYRALQSKQAQMTTFLSICVASTGAIAVAAFSSGLLGPAWSIISLLGLLFLGTRLLQLTSATISIGKVREMQDPAKVQKINAALDQLKGDIDCFYEGMIKEFEEVEDSRIKQVSDTADKIEEARKSLRSLMPGLILYLLFVAIGMAIPTIFSVDRAQSGLEIHIDAYGEEAVSLIESLMHESEKEDNKDVSEEQIGGAAQNGEGESIEQGVGSNQEGREGKIGDREGRKNQGGGG